MSDGPPYCTVLQWVRYAYRAIASEGWLHDKCSTTERCTNSPKLLLVLQQPISSGSNIEIAVRDIERYTARRGTVVGIPGNPWGIPNIYGPRMRNYTYRTMHMYIYNNQSRWSLDKVFMEWSFLFLRLGENRCIRHRVARSRRVFLERHVTRTRSTPEHG